MEFNKWAFIHRELHLVGVTLNIGSAQHTCPVRKNIVTVPILTQTTLTQTIHIQISMFSMC